MMNELDYQRAAEWLDGQTVELTAQQQELADELRRDQADMLGMLNVRVPGEVMARAQRRLVAATARPKVRAWAVVASAATAAAAVVLLTVLLKPAAQTAEQPTAGRTSKVAPAGAAYLAAVKKYADDDELDKIAMELDDLEANIASLSRPPARDARIGVMIDVLEADVEDFSFDNVLPDESEI